MSYIIKKAISYHRSQGTKLLLLRIYQKLIYKLLIKREREWFGIIHPARVRAPEVYFENIIPYYPPKRRGDGQFGEIYSHRNYTQIGDTVIIIGGGGGISAVAAAQEVGKSGSVYVYEPAREQRNIIKTTAELNNVTSIISIRSEVVGEGINIFGDSNDSKTISPKELPDCDILELDCEGAELGILEELDIRPRVITVEIHNGKIFKSDEVIEEINNMGYTIQERTANGETISESEFQKAVKLRCEKTPSANDWYEPPKIIALHDG